MRISDWSADVCSSDLTPPASGEEASHRVCSPRARHSTGGHVVEAECRSAARRMGRAKGETHQIAGPHLKLTRPRYSTPLLRYPPTHRAQVRSYKTPDTPHRRYAPNTPPHITRNEHPSPHDLIQRLPLRQFVDQLVPVPLLPDQQSEEPT